MPVKVALDDARMVVLDWLHHQRSNQQRVHVHDVHQWKKPIPRRVNIMELDFSKRLGVELVYV